MARANKISDKKIGEKIRDSLDGRTQRWLSKKVSIPEVELSNKINGFKKFEEEDLVKIAESLKIKL